MVDNLETPLSNSTVQAAYTINAENIKERAVKQEERNAAAAKPAETKVEAKPGEEVKPVVDATKPVVTDPAKLPANDPTEFNKKITAMGQENAQLKKDMTELRTLLEQFTQKPIDPKEIAELAKDPKKLQEKIDGLVEERVNKRVQPIEQEHIRDTSAKVIAERERRRTDAKYPRWSELENLMGEITIGLPKDRKTDAEGNVTGPGDPRINFNKPTNEVLDDMYELAKQIQDEDNARKGITSPATSKPAETPVGLTAEEKTKIADEERERIRKELRAEAIKEQAGGTAVGSSKGSSKGRGGEDDLSAKVSKDGGLSINAARDLLKKQKRR